MTMSTAKYLTDDRVYKIGTGYRGPGKVEAAINIDGDWRYVVSHRIEGGEGKLLHIYGEAQLKPAGASRRRRVTP